MASVDASSDTIDTRRAAVADTRAARWRNRPRLLALAALIGCVGVFLLARWLADPLQLNAHWQVGAGGRVELAPGASANTLKPHAGKSLVAVSAAEERLDLSDALVLQRSPRWMIDDELRERHRQLHAKAGALLAQPSPSLHFGDGTRVDAPLQRLGFDGLGGVFWLLSAIAFALYLSATVMVLAGASARNLLYALIALCQAGNLLFIASASTPRLALPHLLIDWDMPLRMGFDLVSAAAAVQVCSLYAVRQRAARFAAMGAWAGAAVIVALQVAGQLSHAWWWTQLGVLALCGVALAILSAAYRAQPHPLVMQLRRFGTVVVATWALLTFALAFTGRIPAAPSQLVGVVSTIWYVFLASLLLLVPFLARSQQILREFSLLAAISTVAASLDLVFVDLFELGQFASLTLSLFIALAAYAGARQWILNQLLTRNMLTTERMFEQLYRSAREVEAHPDRAPRLMMALLHECFEPLQAELGRDVLTHARVEDQGSSLVAPVPALASDAQATGAGTSVRLRHAQRGRRPFSIDDARLADRIVEQLRRAVAFDRAVEQGRNEERSRIAQDLHDDIGARLLTLMYKAQSPEMEEYLRHTLKDLKTLTRGLAKGNHRLSHAAAEWKADLAHRLTAADIALGWNFSVDRDVALNVVQWSALTRILRELVSNTIAHAGAGRVDIALHLEGDGLVLSVTDDGIGRDPLRWSHGLGLGGVRKRVKQLGGEVEWLEVAPVGIACRVRIPALLSGA
ncbi:MAG: histidine kinase [Rhizobacter sp.]|nr:histidine kinase [Rhizobacter sp.]